MNKVVTATELRNDLFKLLDLVEKSQEPIFINRHNKVSVKLDVVKDESAKEKAELKMILDKTWGMWADKTEEELVGNFRRADSAYSKRLKKRALGK